MILLVCMRLVNFVNGQVYHIYNRGVRKDLLFYRDSDYVRWENLLSWCSNYSYPFSSYVQGLKSLSKEKASLDAYQERIKKEYRYSRPLVNILCYIEMPNHFHLVLEQNVESGISLFMQKLSIAYAMYLNSKYELSGSAFQGKYKFVHVETDAQLVQLLKYMLLNPVVALIVSILNLKKYKWSALKEYLGNTDKMIIDTTKLPSVFINPQELLNFLKEESGSGFTEELGSLVID